MDYISKLPNSIISDILSLLPTKQAASTSVLSKRWRLLFTSVTNLHFQSSEISSSFMNFVKRLLALQGNSPLNRFSLHLSDDINDDDDDVDYTLVCVNKWILNALRRGVSDLELSIWEYTLPIEILTSKTLVKLKLDNGISISFSKKDVVFLPKLKILDLDCIVFEEEGVGLSMLLSGCPVLEELVMTNMEWEYWDFACISVPTLKRLKFFYEDDFQHSKSVSFDVANLEYFEYSDNPADKYPIVNFGALVEAHIGLRISDRQITGEKDSDDDEYIIMYSEEDDDEDKANATDFIMGLTNVQILYLTAQTLEILAFCCKTKPVFNNLVQLTVESDPDIGWDSLPGLLKNCPNVQTLIFKGLYHKSNKGCGDMCNCSIDKKSYSCLSTSPVKVLKVIMNLEFDDEGMEEEQMKLFLEKMPCLEEMIVYFDISYDPSVIELSNKLLTVPRASPKCKIQVLSRNLNLSSTLPSTLFKKSAAPQNEEYAWFLKDLI